VCRCDFIKKRTNICKMTRKRQTMCGAARNLLCTEMTGSDTRMIGEALSFRRNALKPLRLVLA